MASRYPKRAKYACFIDSLPDPILAKIFSYLPLKERLHLSAVCARWYTVTHLDWLDVIDLDLTPIPSPSIGAVLRLSPDVGSIFALRRLLILNDLTEHYQINVTSVKLYDAKMCLASITGDEKHTNEYRNLVRFMYDMNDFHPEHQLGSFLFHDRSPKHTHDMDLFVSALNRYFEKLPQLEELVLHNLRITDLCQLPATSIIPFAIQTGQLNALARLQLSGTGMREFYSVRLLKEAFCKLRQLECLALHISLVYEYANNGYATVDTEFFDALGSMKNLRELSLATQFYGCNEGIFYPSLLWRSQPEVAFKLPKLEVYILKDQRVDEVRFGRLFTAHPTLRILMLAGSRRNYPHEFVVPVRKLQSGAAVNPLPFLHVFLGHGAHHNLRFTETATAKVHLFDCPIHEFLARDEIAAILDGVWVAEMFNETASYDPYYHKSRPR